MFCPDSNIYPRCREVKLLAFVIPHRHVIYARILRPRSALEATMVNVCQDHVDELTMGYLNLELLSHTRLSMILPLTSPSMITEVLSLMSSAQCMSASQIDLPTPFVPHAEILELLACYGISNGGLRSLSHALTYYAIFCGRLRCA